ncbi:MAG TPA: TetR/AcrR family transcriptional regulator, partial [Verrucomicrobium sp.]|nr:TetR/AcrR family transcriptional regulator [Verrucomicrobium sp.]
FVNTSSPPELSGRRSRERDRKIGDVLEAAGRVFAAKGFHGASMEDIARAADYATGAIYRYFSGKDALFMALLERRMEELMAYVLAETEPATDPAEALQITIRAQIEFAARDPSLLQIYFSEGLETVRNEEWDRRFSQRRLKFEKWLGAQIIAGQRAGCFHPGDARLYVMIVQGMVVGLFRQWASSALSPRQWAAQSRFVVQCALRALCIHPPS